jgi:hypothetical protein
MKKVEKIWDADIYRDGGSYGFALMLMTADGMSFSCEPLRLQRRKLVHTSRRNSI